MRVDIEWWYVRALPKTIILSIERMSAFTISMYRYCVSNAQFGYPLEMTFFFSLSQCSNMALDSMNAHFPKITGVPHRCNFKRYISQNGHLCQINRVDHYKY